MIAALTDLDAAVDVEELAVRALALCVAARGARLGWLCVGSDPREPLFTATTGPGALESTGSTGIVEEALTGVTVVTTDAAADPRFRDRPSVRRGALEVVMCAPIGAPPVGVVYLQGGAPPGPEGVAALEHAARFLAPLVRDLLARRRWEDDATADVRARFPAPGVVGRSAAMARLLERLAVVAPSRVPLLLEGPTGTGKTLLARAVHDASPCADGPFVTVDCTLLRGERAAAELFGARRGSWTGLDEDREGWFARADGGTLFLDEVGELPLDVQPQLLAALQTGTWTRLGETRTRRATVRLMAATHRPLDAWARSGAFREDLLHRLAGFRVAVPSLAERRDDIGLVAAALLDAEAGVSGLRTLPLTPAAVEWLERRPWPGNVRELGNAVRAGWLWAHAEGADALAVRHLERGAPPTSGAPETPPDDLRTAVRRFRARHVRTVLAAAGGNVSEAARRLGITRTHLHELLREPAEPVG